jgi:hypothetical protein
MSQNNSFNNAFPPLKIQAMNGNSPQNAALNSFTQGQEATANLSKLSGGKKYHRYYGGQSVYVPQANMGYTDIAVPAINGKGGLISQLIATSNQSASNNVFDKNVSKGGSRKRKTKRLLNCGCSKKIKKRKHHKSIKHRKSIKKRKHHK